MNIATHIKARSLSRWLWLCPLLLNASDAHAWGLYTHVWFAQALVWLVPLADPRFRRAVQRFPTLLMAGACLPDLVLVRDFVKDARNAERFSDSHDWHMAMHQLQIADTDEQRALALGFASHLLTDIFAHNHFVPTHEAVWFDVPVMTHAGCEWALDQHVSHALFSTPAKLLSSQRDVISDYLAFAFECDGDEAKKVVMTLARADRLLRLSQLPRIAFAVGSRTDKRMIGRFNHYLDQTVQRLGAINSIIAGDCPEWHANPARESARQAIAGLSPQALRSRTPLPDSVFVQLSR